MLLQFNSLEAWAQPFRFLWTKVNYRPNIVKIYGWKICTYAWDKYYDFVCSFTSILISVRTSFHCCIISILQICSNDLFWYVNSLCNETTEPKDEKKTKKADSMIFVLIFKTSDQYVKEIRKNEIRVRMNKWNTRDKSDTNNTCIISYSNIFFFKYQADSKSWKWIHIREYIGFIFKIVHFCLW